jgi:hypothetical protein
MPDKKNATLFRCINPMGASPCIEDSRFNRDSKSGLIDGRVKRRNRHVPFGRTTAWVDPASRQHFEPVNDEARKANEDDYKWLIEQLAKVEINGKKLDVPEDATLSELGEWYNKYDKRLNLAIHAGAKKKKRVIGLKNVDAKEDVELTNAELKAILDDRGISYGANDNKAKLKELVAESEPE